MLNKLPCFVVEIQVLSSITNSSILSHHNFIPTLTRVGVLFLQVNMLGLNRYICKSLFQILDFVINIKNGCRKVSGQRMICIKSNIQCGALADCFIPLLINKMQTIFATSTGVVGTDIKRGYRNTSYRRPDSYIFVPAYI